MAHKGTQVYMNVCAPHTSVDSQPSIATITKTPTMLNKTCKMPVILGKSVDQDAIKSFLVTLQRNCDLFDSSMHHDAHEFLIFTLNRIGEDLAAQTKQNKGERAAGTPSVDKDAVPRTYVHRLFQGILTNETRCLTCESISNRDEEFLDLSINVAPFTSVSSCLRKFSESEMLSGRNKFFCDTCASLQEAEKRIKIRHLPDILALHLKRFGWDEGAQAYIKNACRVVFPLDLRLFNASNQANNPDREYELFGIVVHVGAGAHQGHYISVIRVGPRWVLFDDELAETISESEIAKFYGDSPETGSAYVLFYRALDMDNSAGKSPFVPKNGTCVSTHTSFPPHIVPLANSPSPAHKPPEMTSVLTTSPLLDPLPAPALAVSAAPKPMLVQPTHAAARSDELDEHTISTHETLSEEASNDRHMPQSQVPSRRPWLGRSRFSRRRS
ncbi:ubiquitinyl hydrolase 1 [Malassezia vespertilionis]|uniref:ubiquitinyl hydrolase 1 n=1 Tax=Malassezia vespertilionis TaxID=2020962 RepID=UPI0024B16561|nr:ubiquitinyl hydrolase 1 [Malassezia vespertilionis]WFD06751.1 ubiquitinyl hydrolase 1 [Malassezia vespertilionis]